MDSVKPTSLKIEDVHVDLVVPNPDNINEMDEKTFGYLVENIREVGLIDPIQVIPIAEGKYFLMGGEHRWKAAKQLGYQYVPAVILTDTRWSDSDYTDLVSFRMNVLRGNQKPERFLKVYDRMASKFGAERLQEVFQIADKVLWKRLTKNLTRGMRDQGVPEALIESIETASDKSKSFESFNKKLTKILTEYQNAGVITQSTVVFHAGKRMLMVTVDDEMFSKIEAVSSSGVSISEVLKPAIDPLYHGLSNPVSGAPPQ